MIYLTNMDNNVKLGFDFLENLPTDFGISKSKFENWAPFVLNVNFLGRTVAITEDMQAYMTIYEIEKIFNDLKHLLDDANGNEDKRITHYSSESFFEFSLEYLHVDECFSLELWFVTAKFLESEILGCDVGFRFTIDKTEMDRFAKELYNRFNKVCPQCSI